VHPLVNQTRERLMSQAGDDPKIVAFIWDTPLLFETGLNKVCDRVVFVDAPLETRARRVKERRGWSQEELAQRENLQMPLDNKRRIADDQVVNAADSEADLNHLRAQVRQVLSRILADYTGKSDLPAGV
jgi:dephospho-CoA kinase